MSPRGDGYFSRDGGLEESRSVFLGGNGLPGRWQARRGEGPFVVGEIGFGTGLNFLATWQAWREARAAGERLHYTSFEFAPLAPADMVRAWAPWPELGPLGARLLDALPPPFVGVHRIEFPGDGVTLDLVVGDARDWLRALSLKADAWFLDGFAPGCNAEAWGTDLLAQVVAHSAADATFSTYCAASDVRRGLAAVGFEVERIAGFGRKRERLQGRLAAPTAPVPPARRPATVAVVGGGLAGAAAALAFARRGAAVQLFESAAALAAGASGNLGAILMPHLAAAPELRMRLSLAGFHHTRRVAATLPGAEWNPCGAVRLANSDRLRRLWLALDGLPLPPGFALAVSADAASALAGTTLGLPAIHYPAAGALSPRGLVAALCDSAPDGRLEIRTATPVESLVREADQWMLRGAGGGVLGRFEHVVLASSHEVQRLLPEGALALSLEAVRGQVAHLDPPPAALRGLGVAVCHDGYAVPPRDGQPAVVGASFEHGRFDPALDPAVHADILERLMVAIPGVGALAAAPAAGRVGFRCSTHDRLPVVGRVPHAEEFAAGYRTTAYHDLAVRHDEPWWFPGLQVTTGHGSQGLTTCLLAGELLAAEAFGEPLPLDEELRAALSPLRYLVRALNRSGTNA